MKLDVGTAPCWSWRINTMHNTRKLWLTFVNQSFVSISLTHVNIIPTQIVLDPRNEAVGLDSKNNSVG
jgi:hypothetical protein